MIVYLIDPPWPKRKGGKRSVRPAQGSQMDYKTMSVSAIFSLLDRNILICSDNHAVFLWTVDEFLHEAEQAMLARGYRRHCRFVWDKLNGVAPAFTIRYCHEYLTWFYKPKLEPIADEYRGKFRTVLTEAAREHSRKPEVVFQMLEKLYPASLKIDVFSRQPRLGWVQFGDQCNTFRLNTEESR